MKKSPENAMVSGLFSVYGLRQVFFSFVYEFKTLNSLFDFFAIVNTVFVFIPVYRDSGKAKPQTMAQARKFYFLS